MAYIGIGLGLGIGLVVPLVVGLVVGLGLASGLGIGLARACRPDSSGNLLTRRKMDFALEALGLSP